jgi:hypothetical protein
MWNLGEMEPWNASKGLWVRNPKGVDIQKAARLRGFVDNSSLVYKPKGRCLESAFTP